MIRSQMLKGTLEGCILEIIRKEPTYAYEISEKLKGYGFGSISEGTIYPVILRLQKHELLQSEIRESVAGPQRKYYSLTEKGCEELNVFVENWKELSGAVEQVMEWGHSDEEKDKTSAEAE